MLIPIVISCGQAARYQLREREINPDVLEICEAFWHFDSLHDLERVFGTALSDEVELVPNHQVKGEVVRVHRIQFKQATAGAIEAPSGTLPYRVS